MSSSTSNERKKAMLQTSTVGAVVNFVLSFGKIIFGWLGNSSALIADGVHSFADLATDAMVWITAHISTQPADKEHPYGHGRIETIFTVLLGLVLLLTSAGIAWDAAKRLFEPETLLIPAPFVLLIAFISIVANEGLYQYTMIFARKHKSALLKANAWHHRSDAISSIVVLLGVAGSLIGFHYLDAIAATLVAFMIGKIGWEQAWKAVMELIDTGLDPKKVSKLTQLLLEIEGVRDIHLLRTRLIGGSPIIDVHVQVDGKLSVSEGHRIAEHVRHILLDADSDIVDVTVHIDPENDETHDISSHLPMRSEIIHDLNKAWFKQWPQLSPNKITLHYLHGKVQVEIISANPVSLEFQQELTELANKLTYIGQVKLLAEAQ